VRKSAHKAKIIPGAEVRSENKHQSGERKSAHKAKIIPGAEDARKTNRIFKNAGLIPALLLFICDYL
jgi:hypothetical protein